MRIFEKLVFKQEIRAKLKSIIGKDQFAYRKGSNTTMAIIKCQHQLLKWLEAEDVDFIRVISFDFSKAFDSFPLIFCGRSQNKPALILISSTGL